MGLVHLNYESEYHVLSVLCLTTSEPLRARLNPKKQKKFRIFRALVTHHSRTICSVKGKYKICCPPSPNTQPQVKKRDERRRRLIVTLTRSERITQVRSEPLDTLIRETATWESKRCKAMRRGQKENSSKGPENGQKNVLNRRSLYCGSDKDNPKPLPRFHKFCDFKRSLPKYLDRKIVSKGYEKSNVWGNVWCACEKGTGTLYLEGKREVPTSSQRVPA